MDADRWRRMDALFQEALDCAPQVRAEKLRRGCGGDAGLRAEVEALLVAHERASSFISAPAFQTIPKPPIQPLPAGPQGERVGRYQLRSIIGRGGLGIVYEAEQDNPRRTVALKLLRDMPLRDEMTARLFRREAQALARLDHPAIATIYEAGTSEQGWRYFAMERVLGASLTRYAAERALAIPERLELFARVCDAVEYAHQQGVIHRDLKPANIFVTADGQPKVLDFGASLLRDPDSSLAALVTLPGQLVGTLPYMSPEQVNGRRSEIGPATDVYSLGVTLYELLTGKLPYDLADMTLVQAAAAICRRSPQRPSSINPAIGADLESIVIGSMEKEPGARYASPAALAADVRRVLQGERAIGGRKRFTSPRRAVLGGTVLAIAAIVLFVAFVSPTFGPRPPEVTDHPIVMVDSPFRPEFRRFRGADLEAVEAEFRQTLSETRREDRDHHDALRELGTLLELQGRFAESEAAYESALDQLLAASSRLKPIVRMRERIGGVIAAQGRTAEAEQIWSDVLAQADNAGHDSQFIGRIHVRCGMLLAKQGRKVEAIRHIEAAIAELEHDAARNAECLNTARALLEDVRR